MTTERNARIVRTAIVVLIVAQVWPAAPVSGQAGPSTWVSPKVADQLTGLAWSGHGMIASYSERSGGLLNVSLDGRTSTRFAPSFGTYNESYIALSTGLAGFPQGRLFVSTNASIYELDPAGSKFQVFSTPPGASRIGFLAFDTLGAWGYQLLAVDDNGLLWTIASNGTARVITNFGIGVKPESIAVAPQSFGRLAGYLFVGLEYAFKVVELAPSDPQHPVTAFQTPGEGPERVLLVPPASDLYVAMFNGSILKVGAATLSPYVGELLVITEGDSQPVGSITALSVVSGSLDGTRLLQLEGHPHLEGADFVPASMGEPWSTSSSSGHSSLSQLNQLEIGAVAVAVVLVVGVLVRRRLRWSEASEGAAGPGGNS